MMDVEQLLRETLADPRHRLEPEPGMYETVRRRARERRQRVVRVASAFTAVVVIAGVVTAIGASSGHSRRDEAAASPSITPSPSAGQAAPVDLGRGATTSIALAPSGLLVARAQPDELVQLSTTDLSVTKRITTPRALDNIAVDAVTGRVWIWSSTEATSSGSSDGSSSTSIQVADSTSTFAIDAAMTLSQPTLPMYAFSGAAIDDELWLATSDGLWVISSNKPGTSGAAKVADGTVYSVVADPVRHRILYGSSVTATAAANSLGGVVIHEIDDNTHSVIAVGSLLPIGKESIAIVGDQIWVGGYGSGSTPRLFHLDGSSLQTLQTNESAASNQLQLGPGAIVWPGASVVWVRSGGSEGLTCVDPQSGAVLEQWGAVQGPVVSVRGHAYAVSDGSLQQLTLVGDCSG
jgi:hypothetical protein